MIDTQITNAPPASGFGPQSALGSSGPDLALDVQAVMGLREPPFADRSSDLFFYPSSAHLRAHSFIGQLVYSRASVAVLTGESGMGKSLLVRRVASDLDERVFLAHVQVSSAAAHDAQEFLKVVLHECGIELGATDRSDRRRLLHKFLSHQFGQNRICLLAFDAVHTFKPAVLEELRRMAEIEVDGKRLVKVLLLGSVVVNRVVDSPRMASMCLGRATRMSIEAFTEGEVAAYIAHRLRAAGALDPEDLLPASLIPVVRRFSGGIPHVINQLCERALSLSVEMGEVCVTEAALIESAERLGIIPQTMDIVSASAMNARATSAIASNGGEQQSLLVITTQGASDVVIPVTSARTLIGRSELADVRIESTYVSRYHSLLVREMGVDTLIDLGSTNGLLVNGKRVSRAALKHRDFFQVGAARVTYLNLSLALPATSETGQGNDPANGQHQDRSSETVRFASPSANRSDTSGEWEEPSDRIVGFGRED